MYFPLINDDFGDNNTTMYLTIDGPIYFLEGYVRINHVYNISTGISVDISQTSIQNLNISVVDFAECDIPIVFTMLRLIQAKLFRCN